MNLNGTSGPPLYAWDVAEGACGVTEDRDAAIRHVRRGLEEGAPGTRGEVRRVAVSMSGRVEYLQLGVVVEGRRDARTGGVVWVI
ncbi:hypothetical protein [Actinomadura sp. 9N215]|uniref:hypothetical protein n=1 Tax=Actinomadura sp. 9N215 TaxID=3375150 RepID=UPI00379D301C